jgi:hypothetical protein
MACNSNSSTTGGVPAGMVVVSQGGMDQLKSLQRRLRARGIESELVSPGGGGCGSS